MDQDMTNDDNEIYTAVSKILIIHMRMKNLNPSSLGRKLGMDRQTMHTRMTGTTKWKLHEIVKVCEVLGIDIGQMLHDALTGAPIELDPDDVRIDRSGWSGPIPVTTAA